MAKTYEFPSGAIENNRGLPPGTRITEITGHPYLDHENDQWHFTPEIRTFEILSIGVDSYECRYLDGGDTWWWPFWSKQPNQGFASDGSSPVSYYLPEPYPRGKAMTISPYTMRCDEIDAAAVLITDPDAFAKEAAEDRQLSEDDPATFLEKPHKSFALEGGCPAYDGVLNRGCPATVICRLVEPQLHSYIGEKFCKAGRNVYCPIWRSKWKALNEKR